MSYYYIHYEYHSDMSTIRCACVNNSIVQILIFWTLSWASAYHVGKRLVNQRSCHFFPKSRSLSVRKLEFSRFDFPKLKIFLVTLGKLSIFPMKTIFLRNFNHFWEIDFTPKALDRIILITKFDYINSFIYTSKSVIIIQRDEDTYIPMIAINNHSLICHGLLVLLAVLPEGFYWWSLARYCLRCCSQWVVGLDCWVSLKR